MQRIRPLKDLNPHLMCVLCGGYLIDATTLNECLHSFCRACIVKYLETSYNCPVCDTEIHKTKPLANIRSDPTLQEIVYKLVPGLYERENARQKAFEGSRPKKKKRGIAPSPTEKQSDHKDKNDRILVTLKYFRGPSKRLRFDRILSLFPTRYLCCPHNLPVRILKKFVLQKFDLPIHWEIDLWRGDETLLDNLNLKDIIRIYGAFLERKPLELYFSVLPQNDDELNGKDQIQTPSSNPLLERLKKQHESASADVANTILTNTPDPSDEERSMDNNDVSGCAEEKMEVGETSNVSNPGAAETSSPHGPSSVSVES